MTPEPGQNPPTPPRHGTAAPAIYPAGGAARTRWILGLRGARQPVTARRPNAFFVEAERAADGCVVPVVTILLTNRECPYRCVMCDLWQNTLPSPVPPGAVPSQIDYALRRLRAAHPARIPIAGGPMPGAAAHPTRCQIKLYNAGSFFDPGAIPRQDYPAIVARVTGFERVIVECHPALVGDRVIHFRDLLEQAGGPARARAPRLEVALGLETAHAGVLAKLNKCMSLPQFRRAAQFLQRQGIALRVFVLVQPPFLAPAEALEWTQRSVEFAFDCGATAVTLIPTRPGNGALEALAAQGEFVPPRLSALESALAAGLAPGRGRVFADTWSLEPFADCPACFAKRVDRLRRLNLAQQVLPAIRCAVCGAGEGGPLASRPSG